MKVLHVVPSLDPASGGPPNVAAGLAAAQAFLGCETQILSYAHPSAESRVADSIITIPNIDKVKLQYLSPPTRTDRFFARVARRWMNQPAHQFDIIHLHGIWDPLIRAVGASAAKSGTPFIVTPHGMLDSWALSQKPLRKKAALALGYRKMLDQAAFLHYLTSVERDRTATLNLKPPSRVIPNGVFLEQIDPLPPKGAFRAMHPELADAQLILFLGRLHYKKGLDILAPAFAAVAREFPKAHLIIAGPDYGARAGFEAQVAQLGIQSRVHVMNPIYGQQKIAAFHDCNCFCLPSRQEGFSLAIIEAMACESPVVITPECNFPDVNEGKAGLIAELDPPCIAAALATILRDAPAAEQMGIKGREMVMQRFTWRKIAEQMIHGYQQVITERIAR